VVVDSPLTDSRSPWWIIMVPLPPKVFLSSETAENAGQILMRGFGVASGTSDGAGSRTNPSAYALYCSRAANTSNRWVHAGWIRLSCDFSDLPAFPTTFG
jgi:hypothetical protein